MMILKCQRSLGDSACAECIAAALEAVWKDTAEECASAIDELAEAHRAVDMDREGALMHAIAICRALADRGPV